MGAAGENPAVTIGKFVAVAASKLGAAEGGLLRTIVGVLVNGAISEEAREAVTEDNGSVVPIGKCTDVEHAPPMAKTVIRRITITVCQEDLLVFSICDCLEYKWGLSYFLFTAIIM